MKNVLIILVSVAVLAAVGFVGTVETARRVQNRQQAADEARLAQTPVGSTAGLNQAFNSLGVATENLRRRQNYAFIGGGVGAAAGLAAGIGIAATIDRRRKRTP